MRISAKSVIAALVLVGGIAPSGVALANAPPVAERPSDQQRSGPSTSAIERERRYAGLTLGEAIRQSLIDDDMDFAYSTMAALGQSAGDSAGARYFSGVRAFARGDFADASDLLKDADSEDILVSAVRAWSLVAQNKGPEAVRVWDVYGDSGQKPFYATYRALLAEQAGQTEAALRQYHIAQSTGELLFAKDLARRYVSLLVKAGKDRDAVRVFDEIFGESNTLDAHDRAFRQSLVTKRPQALPAITPPRAVSGLMSNYAAAGILVRMMRPSGDDTTPPRRAPTGGEGDALFVSDALTFRTALLIDPGNIEARLSLARLFMALDEDEAAQKTLEPIDSGPRLNEARLSLAGLYGSLENPRQGLEVLDAIPADARDANWWDRRGDLLLARGLYTDALTAVQRSVALAKGKGDWAENIAQVSLANALIYTGQKKEGRAIALNLVNDLEKRSPLRGAAARLILDDPDTRILGMSALREALNAFAAGGQTKVAVGSLFARDPGTRAEGIALIREGVAEFPRSPIMMNALGYSLVTYDVDLEEGYRLLQKAHGARPNSGAIMDSLGRANYKLGNLDEAQRLIEGAVAVRVDSPDPEIFDNLGDVYWHQGRKEDARAQWRRAKEIGGVYEHGDDLDIKIRDGLIGPAPVRRDVPLIAEPGSV